MRSFIALPLPDPVTGPLADLGTRLRVGRAVDEENLHLTLAFLEDQPMEVLEDLHGELELIRAPEVTLNFLGLEPMGGKTPSVLALRAEGAEALQAQVMRAVRRAGIQLPHRKFRGHVTLARLNRRPGPADQAALGKALLGFGTVDLPPVSVDTLALYKSDLFPDGPRYEVLAEYGFAG